MRVAAAVLPAFAVLAAGAPAAAGAELRQPAGRVGCVTADPRDGCEAVRGVRGFPDWRLSDDEANLYGVAGDGRSVVTLRRRPDGGFRQLAGRRGCLAVDARSGCRRASVLSAFAHPWVPLPVEGRRLLVLDAGAPGVRVLSLVRERRTGALRAPTREDCVADRRVAGCRRMPRIRGSATAVAASREARDIYVATDDAIVHLRREPGGGLQRVAGAAGCLARARAGCRTVTAMPADPYGVELVLSDGGRTLNATFEGAEDEFDVLLRFARDPSTGRLEPPPPAGCISAPVDDPACTGWPLLHLLILDFGALSDASGYVVSSDYDRGGDDSVVAVRRDPATGAIAPADGPGACLGDRFRFDESLAHPGEPCTAVPEWRRTMPFTVPLVSADGRNAYIWSQADQNFGDYPVDGTRSSLIGFARDPLSGGLTRLAGRRGCLGARRVPSCAQLTASFVPDDAIEVAGGRAVVLATSGPQRGVSLRVLRRGASDGALAPVRGRGGCLAPSPRPDCRRIRGLKYSGTGAGSAPTLTLSRDGRYLYAVREAVAVFRVRP